MTRNIGTPATAETMSRQQREIAVSEFFLKNRHLLGFDNPRKALLTAVKEAVDNSLDACEEAGILPEVSVDVTQLAERRFRIVVTDNGPGVVRQQVPRIFAKLLYGSKFHRLRMSRGQQGIGISAAVMYGQLTTGTATRILSRLPRSRKAHLLELQIDTRKNTPTILRDVEEDWRPAFPARKADGAPAEPVTYPHGTSVAIELEAAYVRGRLSVDEYLRQCLLANPHLTLHYRITLLAGKDADAETEGEAPAPAATPGEWVSWSRVSHSLPPQPAEIRPHPHGVELGMLMQMLRDTKARHLRQALTRDFSRVSPATALEICRRAGLNPDAHPGRIASREVETLFRAIGQTKLMRPPTDCLSPIGEDLIIAGLKKELPADFVTAVTRHPTVYRGNPFQIEAGLAYARPAEGTPATDEPIRLLRFANRVPLLYMAGACAIQRAVAGINWKNYGLAQPKGALPLGPAVVLVHIASVWVPFTSESKEAIAHYPEILREITFAVQECGRRLAVFLSRRRRQAELERKRNYIELYIPHLALGLKEILDLPDREEQRIINRLRKLLERTHLAKTGIAYAQKENA